MAVGLPEVTQKFEADTRPYIAALEAAAEAADAFAEANAAAVEAVDALAGAMRDIAGVTGTYAGALRDAGDAASSLSRRTTALIGREGALIGVVNDARDALAEQAGVAAAKADEIGRLAGAVGTLAFAERALKASTRDAGAGAAAAAAGFRILGTGIRLTGTALHWIVAGSFEFLATAIPAMIALGSAALVALQGTVNVTTHMQALYGATEATANAYHQTIGSVLGLRSALQQAQDAANPGVYEVLGSVINDMKARFQNLAGVGLQVVHIFDQFAAKVTLDMRGAFGAEIQGLVSGMVKDLVEFGQILGNLGHAILNFAAAMPGLAQVLLGVADGISRMILGLSNLPHWILTTVMAIEEFFRWGGVVLGLIIALAAAPLRFATWLTGVNFITTFGTRLLTIVGFLGRAMFAIGAFVAELDIMPAAIQAAGAALAAFGVEVDAAAAGMSGLLAAGIALAVAALGFFIYKVATAKDATDKWVASTNKAVQSAQGMQVFPAIARALAENSVKMAQAQDQMNNAAQRGEAVMGTVAGRYEGMGAAAGVAAGHISELQGQQRFLLQTGATVATNMLYLGAAFHTTGIGAAYLAQAAGVNLEIPLRKGSEAARLATQQIANLKAGLGAMTAPASVVGNDMTALGIQSQLASSKVGQLNQAWDSWIASITGGVQAMSQVQTALAGISKGALSSTSSITGAINSVSHSTQSASFSLKGFGQAAMQSWQQFLGAVQPAQQALDSLRTGMAEGVVTGTQFGSTVRGLVGEMLPFTQGNKQAVQILSNLAHEAGGPVTSNLRTLEHWAGVTGRTARDQFAKGMLDATSAMSNMSQVAQNLSAVLSGQLDQAMAADIIKATGLDQLMQKYANDVAAAHTPQSQLNSDLQRITSAMANANRATGIISQGLNHATAQADATSAALQRLQSYLNSLHSKTIDITTVFSYIDHGGSAGHPYAPRAEGGPVAANAPYLVGERGREMFVPQAPGHIVPNPQTEAMLGGGGPHSSLTIDAAGGGPQVFELHSDIHVHLDGQEIWHGQQVETLRYGVRNGSAGSGRWAPGSK